MGFLSKLGGLGGMLPEYAGDSAALFGMLPTLGQGGQTPGFGEGMGGAFSGSPDFQAQLEAMMAGRGPGRAPPQFTPPLAPMAMPEQNPDQRMVAGPGWRGFTGARRY